MPKKYLTIAAILFVVISFAQTKKIATPAIDTNEFADAAHHWYDISDKGNIINPLPNKPRYLATNIVAIADNIILFQKNNGGWPKNYDMQAILTQSQKDSVLAAKSATNTTFDNGTTHTQIVALCKVYTITKVEKYKEAALKGLQFIKAAQYAKGGWPQYFPLEENYSRCITYNDDVFSGIMWLLKDIVVGKPNYRFLSVQQRKEVFEMYNKGLDCILKTQINDAGLPTAWCQQYNEKTLQPAWARKFEPPSICNGESAEIVRLLMSIHKPSKAIIDAIQNAVTWFKSSAIQYTRVKTIPAPLLETPYRISTTDKVVITDSSAPIIWTRYYELVTHRPMFCNRDSKVVYSLAEVQRERRDGYGWYTYAPQKILNAYPKWQQQWAKDNNVLAL
jgi:PelA/Pel-15E family pectate lyase